MSYETRRPRGSPSGPRRSRRDYDDDVRDESDPIPPPPAGAPPRTSALKDPTRTAPRSTSRVRLSDDLGEDADDSDTGSVVGQYVKHRDGKIEYMPTPGSSQRGSARGSARPRDLERKNDPRDREFRDRRDGYNSDEGDALRDARRRPARRAPPPSINDDRGNRIYRDGDTLKQSRRKPNPRGYDSDDDYPPPRRGRDNVVDAALTGGAAAAGYGAARSNRREGRRGGYGDYDEDHRAPPRTSRRSDDRGYDSERPRRSGYGDDDFASRRRATGGGGDRYGPPPSRYDEDPRYSDRMPQRTKSDRRPRYDDDDDDRRGGRGVRGPANGKLDWKTEGLGLFQQHALPVIRKEGGRMAMKQLNKFLAG